MGAGFTREEGHEDRSSGEGESREGRAAGRAWLPRTEEEEEEEDDDDDDEEEEEKGEEEEEVSPAVRAAPRGPAFPPAAEAALGRLVGRRAAVTVRLLRRRRLLLLLRLGSSRRCSLPLM
ncbi:hypothetical protein JRQ81_002486 [Phrynocephalus forsythii]|uniref:Uncharacterized protein n=1 Tax=Phrynocephalus forsythii TaxID=171643 RepID=A0A9Q0XHY5_9SAUR|nr:hypothetical protein JRQ81_002486 [Phrynocephalus forsythii]